jgi:hypothetical protein
MLVKRDVENAAGLFGKKRRKRLSFGDLLKRHRTVGSKNRRGGYGKTIKKKGSTLAPEL